MIALNIPFGKLVINHATPVEEKYAVDTYSINSCSISYQEVKLLTLRTSKRFPCTSRLKSAPE